jgi:AbrB family looped-hinge helix DNA binding protein
MLKLNRGPCSKWDPDAQGRYANIEVAYLLQKTEEVTRRSLLSLLYHYRKGMRTTISSKGQITVPVAVRKALGLHPGAKLDIRLGNNAEFIVSRATGKSFFSEFKGICRKKAPWPSGREAVEKLRGPVGHGDVDSS